MSRRQLVSSDEATVASTQHKKPCSDCPLARKSLAGWLGGSPPEEWVKFLHGEAPVACHMRQGAQCAGAAIYRANVCKLPRDKKLLVLPPNKTLVFSNPSEFLAHHKRTT